MQKTRSSLKPDTVTCRKLAQLQTPSSFCPRFLRQFTRRQLLCMYETAGLNSNAHTGKKQEHSLLRCSISFPARLDCYFFCTSRPPDDRAHDPRMHPQINPSRTNVERSPAPPVPPDARPRSPSGPRPLLPRFSVFQERSYLRREYLDNVICELPLAHDDHVADPPEISDLLLLQFRVRIEDAEVKLLIKAQLVQLRGLREAGGEFSFNQESVTR